MAGTPKIRHSDTWRCLALGGLMVVWAGCSQPQDQISKEHEVLVEHLVNELRHISSDEKNRAAEEARKLLEMADKQTAAKQFVKAQDSVLAALRLDPTNPAVFKGALNVIQSVATATEPEGIETANDLFSQLGGAIPFQPVTELEAARQEYSRAGEQLAEKLAVPDKPDLFNEFHSLFSAARQAGIPTTVRLQLLQLTRSELESVATSLAVESATATSGHSWDDWNTAMEELERAETDALVQHYKETLQGPLTSWRDVDAKSLAKEAKKHPPDPVQFLKKLEESLAKGYRLRADATPYLEAKIAEAVSDVKSSLPSLDTRLADLEACRLWRQNNDALDVITKVAASNKPPLEKCRQLAKVHEEVLEPWVRQRLQVEWDKAFNELDENGKVTAVQLRVTRGLQP
ncbi:MAG: hypothetical protein AB7O68_09295 [Pirellulales bacterium]